MAAPDLRDLSLQLRQALERMPPESVIEILVHVFRTYVVEGTVPLPTVMARPELAGLTFPHLIRRLQLELDLPELELFEVQGERVSVRIGGRLLSLEAVTSPPSAASSGGPAAVTAIEAPTAPSPAVAPAPIAPRSVAPVAASPPPAVSPEQPRTDPPSGAERSGRFGLLEVD